MSQDTKNNSKQDFRNFGFIVGIVAVILGIIINYFSSPGVSIYLIIPGIILLTMALVIPNALKWPYKLWMILAFIMNWFMTRALLGIIFYGVVTPTSFIARLFGKHFLDTKIDKSKKSYWNYSLNSKKFQKINYEKQF